MTQNFASGPSRFENRSATNGSSDHARHMVSISHARDLEKARAVDGLLRLLGSTSRLRLLCNNELTKLRYRLRDNVSVGLA